MTNPKTRQAILEMREGGVPYAQIAGFFSLSPNTVKSICRRSNARVLQGSGQEPGHCKNCGRPIQQPAGSRKRIFCCDRCRYEWWNRARSRRPYRLTCYCCGKEFVSFGNKKKKFCSRECSRLSRCGGIASDVNPQDAKTATNK